MSEISAHAGAYLKSHDPDRYYASLLLPGDIRAAAQALYAFNAEIARISLRVSEPAPGEIRLQWWVDLLNGNEYGDARKNPLAAALLDTIERFDLPTGPLRRLLGARRFDLYGDPMPDLQTFEGYAGETNSILYQLCSLISNKGNDAGAADAAGHMGVAHALIGHLRSLADSSGRGKIFLPWSVFQAHGVTQSDLFSGKASLAIIKSTASLRKIALKHLQNAQGLAAQLPAAVRLNFAPLAIVKPQLQRLEEYSNMPFVRPPDMADWSKIARLVWWSWRN